mmetsp:Transcript_25677/g.47407  ORF Transcript_25677/g.47407 Transcript_25677/m.47407 type:complete len:213 (-) Transcript_25677:358-996(-)
MLRCHQGTCVLCQGLALHTDKLIRMAVLQRCQARMGHVRLSHHPHLLEATSLNGQIVESTGQEVTLLMLRVEQVPRSQVDGEALEAFSLGAASLSGSAVEPRLEVPQQRTSVVLPSNSLAGGAVEKVRRGMEGTSHSALQVGIRNDGECPGHVEQLPEIAPLSRKRDLWKPKCFRINYCVHRLENVVAEAGSRPMGNCHTAASREVNSQETR